ncbi:AAA family ATPase [Bogoriella caseilytica]|uniref:Nuclease SbcCD subunit C n=1 Tax=Bogoriella caseilytica TaxID=56055 RepID=A0A3N2BER5_9MICO|nr:SMC family ATPase [Bogoriella caseilytica]ROR73756.1 exonuclease SbcC [Bogoriella caseilytica]
MRLHHLRLQAIGPFPGSHEIDLEALGASGLFLLEGPTGAGKSTIIDAIVFALYGQPAGDGAPERLHSHHAAPGVAPEVELVFSCHEGTFRVFRSPKHERPKSRGTGTTMQNARAKLWRLPSPEAARATAARSGPAGPGKSDPDELGEPVSSNVQETGIEIDRILPLSREQFTQTVVLPQGRFADFLHARPEDRRSVLQEIFGTAVYQELQELLREQAGTAGKAVDEAARQVRTVAEEFARCAYEETEPGSGSHGQAVIDPGSAEHLAAERATPAPEDPRAALRHAAETPEHDDLLRLAKEARATWSQRSEEAAAAHHSARAAEEQARTAFDAARALADRLRRREALLADQKTVEQRSADIAQDRERLDVARRAARVAPASEAHAQRRVRQQEEARQLAQNREAAASHGIDVEADHEALHQRLDDLLAHGGGLEAPAQLEAGIPERRAALTVLRDELDTAERQQRTLAERLDQRPAQRDQLHDQWRKLAGAPVAVERAEAALADARETLQLVEQAEEAARAMTTAHEAATACAEADRTAAAAVAAVHQRRLTGMAGELAQELESGQPCAVCGSREHPEPAQLTAEHPGEEEIDLAEATARRAREAHSAAAALLAERRATYASLHERSAGQSSTDAEQRVVAARDELTGAQQREAERRAAERTLEKHDEGTAALRTELSSAESALGALRARVSAQAAQLEQDEATCRAAREGYGSVAERLAALHDSSQALRRYLRTLDRESVARTELRQAEWELAERLNEEGFDDANAAAAAQLPEPQIAALETAIGEHHSEVRRIEQGLADPEIQAVAEAPEPDVEAAGRAHTAALAAADEGSGQAQLAAERCRQVHETADRLVSALTEFRRAEREAGPVRRVAALATAGEGNLRGLTLATYVLLHRFEDVVAEANEQLRAISAGRYALERIDEREGGQRTRRTGLGLQIMDYRTDEARNPRTLSGGETFYVSLCLALGLATVVLKERGGVELGTLFIDEGFGSLDPDTLDSVMSVLHSLRENGRTVGVISHVSEMKSRIPDRVTIRRKPDGSSTLDLTG